MITRLQSVIVTGLVAIGIGLGMVATAAPAESVDFLYKADAKLVHVDNLFLSGTDKVGDRYLVFSPGIEMTLAEQGAVSFSLGYTHHFTAYRDHNNLNNDFPDFETKIAYDSGVLLATGLYSYEKWASNTIEANPDGQLVEWSTEKASGDVHYEMSELTAFRAGLNYQEVDYSDQVYTDYESVSVPLTFFYSVRPTVDLTAGLRYRTVDTFSANAPTFDYEDMFYYVGAVGELFSPKVYGDIKYGYQTRDYQNSPKKEESSSYDVSIIYAANAKTSVSLGMERDYRTSAIGGLAYSFTNFSLGAQYSLTKRVDFSGAIVVGDIVYEDSPREEDITMINLGARYHPNDYLSFSARYEYTDVDGNNKAGSSNYEKNEFSVSASVRY